MKRESSVAAGTVLIVAPTGRDAALAAATLEAAGIGSTVCGSLAELAERCAADTGALLVAEEALTAAQTPRLLECLQQQPTWSDLPLLILTATDRGEEASVRILKLFGAAANVALLERPLQSVTLISAVQTALRARRRQYEVRDLIVQRETALASISDAFAAFDPEFRYTYVNDRAAEYAGRPKAELIGRSLWEIHPAAIGGEFERLAREAMATRQPQRYERYYEHLQSWIETRIYPATDGVVVLSADVTERKKQEALIIESERKLKESEDRLRLATEAAAIGTFDYYPGTGELRLSERAKEVFGLPPDAQINYAAYLDSLHPDDRHIPHETVQRVLQPGNDARYEIEYRTIGRTDGKLRWVAERGRAVFDASGRATRFVGTLVDITEQKNAGIELERAKREAEQANQAKDQFLAMLSHELRTPLTPVLMTIASLRRQPELPEEVQSDLEVLQRNVELEALLIDDLLDLTRITHGKLELHYDAIDIHALLEHAVAISAAEIVEKNLQIGRRFEAREHHAWADAARLQQVFWNLLKNAVKFTPAGGRIDLRTRNDSARNVVIEIADNGVGIDPQVLPRIFDAFEQGGRTRTRQYGGLGLGLAIAKRVIDMHGGTIEAVSGGHGGGATFLVTLKAMETSMLDVAGSFLPPDTRAGAEVRILLVEDHADTTRVLRRILEHAGYEVAHGETIAAARELARTGRFDLVISDLGLPDGSGLELMKSLHDEHGLRGIALSGFGMDDDRAASAAAGFAEHLTKPVDWPQLRDAVERLVRPEAVAAEAR